MTARFRRTRRGVVPVSERVTVKFEGGERVTFRSPLEATVARSLERRHAKWAYEETRLPYTTEHKYNPDFDLVSEDGHTVHVEVKGWFTPQDRSKALAVRRDHPGVDVRFVFEKASTKLRRGSKTSYADWCDKHGFAWAEGDVPDAWLQCAR